MATETNNPETNKPETKTYDTDTPDSDNDVPPVARVFGFAVSEWVTYSFVVISVIAVIFGNIVSGERDVQAERAMATLAALTEAVENNITAGSTLVCDDRLLGPDLLANDFLTLSIKPAPIDEDDKTLGYGPALYVNVVEEEVSGDTWDTAKRLMDLVKEAGEEEEEAKAVNGSANEVALDDEAEKDDEPKNRLREVRETEFGEDEEYLQYYILASEVTFCRQDG